VGAGRRERDRRRDLPRVPLRYFARRVLALEEERPDEVLLAPLARGRFVHAVFQAFFEHWQQAGRGAVTARNLDAARVRFRSTVDELLPRLPEPIARSSARACSHRGPVRLGERVLVLEASDGTEVLERRLEHELNGTYVLETEDGPRTVAVRGKADRIDLLADGTLRVIDYKTGRAPQAGRACNCPSMPPVPSGSSLATSAARGAWGAQGTWRSASRGPSCPSSPASRPASARCGTASRASCGRSRRSRQAGSRRVPRSCDSARAARSRRCAARTTWMREPHDAAARAFASDPRENVVLEASAGTGKTSVLVARYLALLDAGWIRPTCWR